MRPFAALTFVALSLSSFVVATPLDGQIVLPNNEIVEEPRWKYTVCGDGETTVDIQSIEVYPDPPAPGKDLTVTVKARSTEIIEDGAYADVVVKLGRIKLLTKEVDLCEEARKANASVQCPVAPGPYEVQQSVTLPKEIPRVKFDIHIDAWSFDGEDYLFCLDLEADFRWRFPHRW